MYSGGFYLYLGPFLPPWGKTKSIQIDLNINEYTNEIKNPSNGFLISLALQEIHKIPNNFCY